VPVSTNRGGHSTRPLGGNEVGTAATSSQCTAFRWVTFASSLLVDASSSDGDVVHYVIIINLIDPLFSIPPLFTYRWKSEIWRNQFEAARRMWRLTEKHSVIGNFCPGGAISGVDSSVGIASRYGLDGPGIEYRMGTRFPAPVQTGPGAHPASCTMGTGT